MPRDAEAIRRLGTLLRYYGGKVRILHSSLWLPHTPEVVPDLVYASRWPADASTLDKGIATLWTVVNRGGRDVSGEPILQLVPNSTSSRFFDCYRGVELKPMEAVAAAEDDSLRTLSFEMESEGYGCVVETIGAPSKSHADLLATMAKMTRTPLKAYSKAWTFLPQVMVPMGQTPLAKTAPKGMVHIPACTNYSLVTTGIEIEGDDAHGVDVQYPWERQPRKDHKAVLSLKPFYMDRLPVTNERYAEYLTATGYVPDDPANFLKFWNGSKTAPTAIAAMPVTYVSLNEARAFCAWAGGSCRIPTSGSTPRKVPTAGSTRGAQTDRRRELCRPLRAAMCTRGRKKRARTLRRATRRLASPTWLATFGSTRTSSRTSIRDRSCCAAARTIGQREAIGTSRIRSSSTRTTSTFCLTIATRERRRLGFGVWWMRAADEYNKYSVMASDVAVVEVLERARGRREKVSVKVCPTLDVPTRPHTPPSASRRPHTPPTKCAPLHRHPLA